jgi:hypothetical protein
MDKIQAERDEMSEFFMWVGVSVYMWMCVCVYMCDVCKIQAERDEMSECFVCGCVGVCECVYG